MWTRNTMGRVGGLGRLARRGDTKHKTPEKQRKYFLLRPKPGLQKLNLNNVLRWESLREKVTSVQTLGFLVMTNKMYEN